MTSLEVETLREENSALREILQANQAALLTASREAEACHRQIAGLREEVASLRERLEAGPLIRVTLAESEKLAQRCHDAETEARQLRAQLEALTTKPKP
jgi:FtsZ-binding cell division protein ZapB